MNLNGSHVETVAKMGVKSEQVFVDTANKRIYTSHWSDQIFVLDLTRVHCKNSVFKN
jgi:hypothetical protein